MFTLNTTSIILSMWMLASGWLAKSNFTSGYTDNTLHYHRVCKLSALVPKKVQTVLRVPANDLLSCLSSSSARVDVLFAPLPAIRVPCGIRSCLVHDSQHRWRLTIRCLREEEISCRREANVHVMHSSPSLNMSRLKIGHSEWYFIFVYGSVARVLMMMHCGS